MRMPPVLDPDQFSTAERSVMLLDGDCGPLGLGEVPVDVPVDAVVRAASLAAAAARADLVVDTWTAAWVHGATRALPAPLTLAVDVRGSRRYRGSAGAVREAVFRLDDLVRLGGVRVTRPLKTAFDLARLEAEPLPSTTRVLCGLLTLGGLSPSTAAALAHLQPPCPGKTRGIDRLGALPRA